MPQTVYQTPLIFVENPFIEAYSIAETSSERKKIMHLMHETCDA